MVTNTQLTIANNDDDDSELQGQMDNDNDNETITTTTNNNINITSIEQFAGSVGGGGAGIVGQLVNAIPAALPALFGGILQTLAKKLSRLSKWDNPESQRIHEL